MIKLNKTQTLVGIILIIAMVFFGLFLRGRDQALVLFLITGLALGYILARSRYGFAGGVKRIYMTGEGSLTRALLAMLAISLIGAGGIHYAAAQNGAVVAFRALEGDAVIPGSGFVAAANLSTIIGGILFGMGMILGGGCASGTLSDSGEGAGRAWITTFFFAIGGIIGHGLLPWWNEAGPGKIEGVRMYLPDKFGYLGAIIVSFIGLLILFALAQTYESRRRKDGTAIDEEYEGSERSLELTGDYKFFSYETYHKLFVERWSFMTGGVLIAMMFIFIINTTGGSWGASGPYAMWGIWLFDKLGITLSSPAFEGINASVKNGLLNHSVSIRNVGIIVGAAIAMLLSGRFKFDFDFTLKDVAYYGLGGLLMGIGAKIAGGCNVGALYSGISNFSLSGWVFMISLVLGGIISLKLFEGKVNVLPKRNLK